jgi:transposase
MLRSGIVNTIREMAVQGKPLRAIARELGLARNTVRKYMREPTPAIPRGPRPSKLDPYKAQIRQWIEQDHLTNCQTMYRRLQAQGYQGERSILKDFVRPLRPVVRGIRRAVIRYETVPGEQLQFDWGEFVYEQQGVAHKVFGFTAVLSYSRMRLVIFVKRTDAPTLVRCLLQSFDYFGGLPHAVLTDRMKTVLLEMQTGQPRWHPRFQELVQSLGISPRICQPATPQTKGKVERSIGLLKSDFWPGVTFTDLEDLNRQARSWCDQRNRRVHATTQVAPVERWTQERLRPLPTSWQADQQGPNWARERLFAEERVVSWDGYVSYDGVLYGLPGPAGFAGRRVQVSAWAGQVTIWSGGQVVLQVTARAKSGSLVPHPEQFQGVLPAAAARRPEIPLGHQVPAPVVVQRPLAEYDQLCGVLSPVRAHEEVAS